MDEDDDAAELLSESLFHSCMSSFDDIQKDDDANNVADEEEEAAADNSSSPDSQFITESHQPQEVATSKAVTSGAADSTIQGVTFAETNNSTASGGVLNSTSSSNKSNSSWSLLSESKERPTIHSITFNRDRTCLIVSTSVGVRIRTLESIHLWNDDDTTNNNNNSDQISNNLTYDVPLLPDGAIYSQLLHNTSLLVVIKPSTPRCCYLYNAKNATFPLAALPLSAAVKRVELTRRVLAALTVDGRVHVFHMADDGGDLTRQMNSKEGRKALRPTWIKTLNIMHPSDSCRNLTRGLDIYNVGSYFDLSSDEEHPLLVCKSFNGTSGTIRVYDPTIVEEVSIINNSITSAVSVGSGAGSTTSSWDYYHNTTLNKKKKRRIKLLSTINAHEHSVTRMLIGSSGSQSFLATTSSKGTTIRLFGLPRGDFLWEFYRGSRSCQFYSLSWSGNTDRLVTYGSSGTVHVFSWPKEKDTNNVADDVSNNDHVEEGDFQHVTDSSTRNGIIHTSKKTSEKPLLRRIGASISKQPKNATTTKPSKHRSFAKLKYKPPTASPTNKKRNPQNQSIIVSLLDRRNASGTIDKNDMAHNEDMMVMCSMDGELRQYYVQNDGRIDLAQLEDVLS